jgi:hypothetical protein
MRDPHSDIAAATAIEIRPYNSTGGVEDTIVLTVDAQSIQEKLELFAPGAIAAAAIEDQRTAAAALLSTVTIQDAAAITRIAEEFRTLHAQYPDTRGLAHPNGFRDVTGPGRLEFLKFGREAAMALGHAGNDGWQYWLDIVDGYLLQDDRDEECMGKWQAASSAGAPERGAVNGEMFVVDQLFRASALCGVWLLTTAPREQPGSSDGLTPASMTNRASARKGYRPEVREWMQHKQIGTIEKAAKRLAVSTSTLKSIMSNKGAIRYGRERLQNVLQQIQREMQSSR